ncbi:MAG: hypothetical protein BIFFINMI_00474 [Phycisphaerae bacterium]|nr:hypothetical protein [Phycisphaerae bacterium]
MSFYVLRNPSTHDASKHAVMDYEPVGNSNFGDATRCPECGKPTNMLPWLPPYRVTLELWTNRYGDIGFGPYAELLLTGNVVEKFRQAGLRGLEVLGKAEIVRVKRRGGTRPEGELPSYFVAIPARSSTKIDLEASGAEFETPVTCGTCRGGLLLRHDRVVVDQATWRGEDIFYARGMPGLIITSQRFATWHLQNQINTGVLVRSEEYSKDFYSAK